MTLYYPNEIWHFRLHCEAILGRGQAGQMRWILLCAGAGWRPVDLQSTELPLYRHKTFFPCLVLDRYISTRKYFLCTFCFVSIYWEWYKEEVFYLQPYSKLSTSVSLLQYQSISIITSVPVHQYHIFSTSPSVSLLQYQSFTYLPAIPILLWTMPLVQDRTRPVDQQSSALPLCYGCPFSTAETPHILVVSLPVLYSPLPQSRTEDWYIIMCNYKNLKTPLTFPCLMSKHAVFLLAHPGQLCGYILESLSEKSPSCTVPL